MSSVDNNRLKPGVLIVDDSRSIQKYVTKLLEDAGFRIFSATDGRMGMQCIESQNPDVVLLDIEMPVMNGLEVLDELEHHKRLYSIVLFTRLSDIKNRITGLEKGADDYIAKPIQPDELIAKVRAAARTAGLKRELAETKKTAEDALDKFHKTQNELIEEQQISALVKIASEMAHEINNPLGYIQGNVITLKRYSDILAEGTKRLMDLSNKFKEKDTGPEQAADEILKWLKKSKIESICRDIQPLISETLEGVERISSILKYLLMKDQAVLNNMIITETERAGK